ncbi:valine--tRNA ligase, mitochondrial-like isoform X2 [Rhodnius prolixus]
MILPPPNITGNLHLGHALTITLQDIIARWKLMKSNEICWVPGFDHAGIATQAVVERTLYAKYGITREQLGQEKLLEEIWSWKREKGKRTVKQIHSLGPVLDWRREIFTLDKEQKKAVVSAIKQLWETGLIYRKASLVNWCCHLGSVLSDIEVTNMKISGLTSIKLPGHEQPVVFGRLVQFAYPVEGMNDEIVVATTRPETIVGDVAVAVHPSDQRYSHLHGFVLRHPLTGDAVPLVLDDDVDPTFGTGAVKITPAHDHLDFKIGRRHNLPIKQVISENGKLSSECGRYSDLNRWEARESILDDLAKRGFLRGIDSHDLQIPLCSRTGDVIELILKTQWFIKCKEMAEKASTSLREGHLILDPEKYNTVWFKWMENIEDWCISRQIWWGHKIPFYHCTYGMDSEWFCASSKEEAYFKAQNKFKSTDVTVEEDSDVLDTWFSSAILPFTAFGWPQQTEFLKYYPLSLMVTGNDILFFWVARMVMLGIQLTNQLPFKKVLLHGIICDKLGRKMSKSKGNVIDPMDIIQGSTKKNLQKQVIEHHENGLIDKDEMQTAIAVINETYPNGIPKCGADSLRFTLLSQKIKNTNVNFDVKECYANKLFCNKLWQAAKFALYWSDKLGIERQNYTPNLTNLSLMDRWILNRLSRMVDVVNNTLEMNEFHVSTAGIKSFFFTDLCGVYIEYLKPFLKSDNRCISALGCEVLLHCLEVSFRCLTPFMPHICEELYGNLPFRTHDSVTRCPWPSNLQLADNELDRNVQEVLNIIEAIRRIKIQSGISSLKDVLVHIVTEDTDKFEDFKLPIRILSKSFEIQFSKELPSITQVDFIKEIVNHNTQIYVEINEAVSLSIESVGPKKTKLMNALNKLQKMRLDKGYESVLPEIQQAHSKKILELNSRLKLINELEERITKTRLKS